MESASVLTSPQATRKEWLGLAALALPTLLVSMDATVTYLALPALSGSLKPSGSQLLWITDMFSFMEGGFLIIMGALGDRVGRKRLLIAGFIAFALASVMAAFSGSAEMLIAARAFLGVTGAIILPCTLSLIRSMFQHDRERTIAFGIYTSCYAGGTMLGPLLGGILLSYFWWGSVFLISVPLMLIFLFASGLLREYRDPTAKQFSIWSALLLLTGMLSIIYGVKRMAESGAIESLPLVSVISGFIISAGFVYAQKVIHNPLIDLRLFRIPVFRATLTTLFVSLFCWSGLYLFVAQYLQLVLNFTPLKAGLLTLLPAALTMIGCMLAPQLLRWFSRSMTIIVGNLTMMAGMVLVTQFGTTPHLLLIILACTGLSLGCGFIVTVGIDMVVSSAPHEQSGAAAGISETSTTFGSAFGVAILGSIGTATYHAQMSVVKLPGIAVTEESMNTLGGALVAGSQLPVESGKVLTVYARTAFIESFHTAAIIGAIIVLITVLIFSLVINRKSVNR